MKKAFTIFTFLLCIFFVEELSAQTMYEDYKYEGAIGPTSVKLTFQVPENFYNYHQGFYYNESNQKFIFKGEDGVFDGKVTLTELLDGQVVGYLVFNDLEYDPEIVGKWFNVDFSKSFDITLKRK